jgi:hypothetical protein
MIGGGVVLFGRIAEVFNMRGESAAGDEALVVFKCKQDGTF